MDHAHMDHSHMDHSSMGHGGMDHGHGGMEDMCNMNMLFTWDTNNLCIVFRQWHIRSNMSLVFSLIAVMLLAIGYEGLRAVSRQYEASLTKQVEALPNDESVTETTPFLPPEQSQAAAGRRAHHIKALLYGLQNFYAFMLMLVFMTYNGFVMIAVSLGAVVGYILFGQGMSPTKENACH